MDTTVTGKRLIEVGVGDNQGLELYAIEDNGRCPINPHDLHGQEIWIAGYRCVFVNTTDGMPTFINKDGTVEADTRTPEDFFPELTD